MSNPNELSLPAPYRWAMLCALIVMSALALKGISASPYFGGGKSEAAERQKGIVEELMEEFGYGFGEVLLILEGDDLFRPDAVAASRQLVADLEATPGIGEVFSLYNLPRTASLLDFAPLLPSDNSLPEAFLKARATALSHALVPGFLSDEAGQTWLMPIGIDLTEFVGESNSDFTKRVRETLARQALPADMKVSATGSLMVTSASAETFEYEQWLFHSIAYVLVFLLAAVLFRSVWAVIFSGGGPVIGVVWTLGIAGLLDLHLSSLTLILLPVMLMMIGFTDSVHLMVHVRKERSRGLSPKQATYSALRLLALPCVLTSVTTGLGFASLLFARSELVRDFGAACALGVVCTLIAVLTFLPFFSSTVLGKSLCERNHSSLVKSALPFAESIINWTLRHSRSITIAGCSLAGFAAWYGASIETENRVRADIPKSSAAAYALRVMDDAFGGSTPIHIEVRWQEPLEEQWDKILPAVAAAQGMVSRSSEHSRPFSLVNVLEFLAPEGPKALAMAKLSLIPKGILSRVWNGPARTASVEFQLPDRGFRYFEAQFATWRRELEQLESAHPGLEFELGGQAIVSGEIYREFTADLVQSLALAAFIILAVLTLAFRSVHLGLISIVPNALPLVATTAALVAIDLPMAGATALVMSLGIAVDDTIHYLTRFRHEYKQSGDLDESIRKSTLGVGKALLTTTVVLIVGFAAVMTSDFPRNRVFSGMICFSLLVALISDLVLLPAMLKLFPPRATSPSRYPKSSLVP
ncbi:MAG: putative RND superfamily exporter protein [Planctomycetota bacterium]|jgi:predicted RND superfamily exporter protein